MGAQQRPDHRLACKGMRARAPFSVAAPTLRSNGTLWKDERHRINRMLVGSTRGGNGRRQRRSVIRSLAAGCKINRRDRLLCNQQQTQKERKNRPTTIHGGLVYDPSLPQRLGIFGLSSQVMVIQATNVTCTWSVQSGWLGKEMHVLLSRKQGTDMSLPSSSRFFCFFGVFLLALTDSPVTVACWPCLE